jgi:hypothetical protein
MENRKKLMVENTFILEDLESRQINFLMNAEKLKEELNALEDKVNKIENRTANDPIVAKLKTEKLLKQREIINYSNEQELAIAKMKIELGYIILKAKQIPLLFLLLCCLI